MTKPNIKRRRSRAKLSFRSKKSERNTRHPQVLWGIIVFCSLIGIICILVVKFDTSISPSHPASIKPKKELPLAPLGLNGLTIKEQVEMLRVASVELGRRLVADFPKQAESHVLLGNTYRQLGQSTQAVDSWNNALRVDEQRVDVYTYLAILAEEKGDAEQALSHWKKVLSLKPNLPGLRDSMANTLITLNQWDRAIELLQEEMQLFKESARTHYLLGRVYSQQNSFTEAAAQYEKSISLDPNWTEAYYELATVLMRSGQRDRARHYRQLFSEHKRQDKAKVTYGYTDREDLLKAKKTFTGLCANAADLYQNAGQDEMVLALLKRIVVLDPNNLGIRKRLAARYQALDRVPEAIEECEQIARLTPDDPVCQMLIGSLSLRLGRYTRAESAYQRMIELAPNLSTGYCELAKIYIKTRRNLSLAPKLAEQAVRLDSTAGNYYVLGLAYHENGDKPSALKALKQALNLDPGNQTYRMAYNQLTISK